MAQAKTLHVPITSGIRQDLSEHSAPVGTITDARNVRFSAVAEVEARPGTVALSSECNVDWPYSGDADFLAAVTGGFIYGKDGFGYQYDFAQNRAHVSGSYSIAEPLGKLATLSQEYLTSSLTLPRIATQAVSNNGYIAICYGGGLSTGGGPLCQIYTEGGTLVASFGDLSNNGSREAVVVAEGSTFVLIKRHGAAAKTISAAVITMDATGAASMGAFVALVTLNSSSSYWAACEWPGIGWALAYQTGAATIQAVKLTGTTTIATVTPIAHGGDAPISIYASPTRLYVGYVDVNSGGDCVASAIVLDTTLVSTSGGVVELMRDVGQANLTLTAPLFGSCSSGTSALFAIGRSLSTSSIDSYTRMGQLTATGTKTLATSSTGLIYNAFPQTCPFNNGMIWLRWNTRGTNSLERSVLVDFAHVRLGTVTATTLSQGRIALSCPSDFVTGDTGFFHKGTPREYSDGWIAGVPRTVRADGSAGLATGFEIVEWLLFSIGEPKQVVRVGGMSIVSGQPSIARSTFGTVSGATSLSNADQILGEDLGYVGGPTIATVIPSTSTGSLTPGSTYQYRAVIERIDRNGVRHRSDPSSISATTTGAADNTITITVFAGDSVFRNYNPFAGTSAGVSDVVHLYRTDANGSEFYRCTPGQGSPTLVLGTLSYVDGLQDTTLRTREILYTDGGVLGNDLPPSCRYERSTEDRVWLGGLWETNEIQSSKIIVPGEPPQFSDLPSFRVVLPEPCTGIAVQDGAIIAFTRNAIYGIQGGGPNDQGQGDWGSPHLITRSSGCISHLSILETSIGVFFQSDEGIELLPRGLGEPQFIGIAVQDLMRSLGISGGMASVVGSAIVTTGSGRSVRFVLDDGSTTANKVLIYSLDTQAWSYDIYGAIITSICTTTEGAVMAKRDLGDDFFAFLNENEATDQDSIGDSPSEIASSVSWAELRPFGIAGFGRFGSAIALFDARSAPSGGYRAGNATITLSVDSRSENGQTFVMTSLTETQAYQRNVPATEAGTCGKLTLTTAVAGWRFSGWTVEADDLGGGRRMAETEQG